MIKQIKKRQSLEKERLFNVQKADFADTFEKFLDYLDEDELHLHSGKSVRCVSCQSKIKDGKSHANAGLKNEKGQLIILCFACANSLEEDPENKKKLKKG